VFLLVIRAGLLKTEECKSKQFKNLFLDNLRSALLELKLSSEESCIDTIKNRPEVFL
jgi:hypothetical protein